VLHIDVMRGDASRSRRRARQGLLVFVLLGCNGVVAPGGYAGPTWVEVEAGEFLMGAPVGEQCRRDEPEPHDVAIPIGFAIASHEVTQAEFESVMGYNPSFHSCQRCPVDSVSWHEAAAYCNTLTTAGAACYRCTGVEGKTRCEPMSECDGYRLPTEAEWEYAARAGSTTPTYAGRLGSCMGRDENAEDIAWYKANSRGESHPVGEKVGNDWGLHDVAGNVAEWTADSARPHERVLKGGSWYHNADHLRSGGRLIAPAERRFGYAGIRCVRS
jgi:formylglycine-generating enzyme required for sulfatase activity